MIFVTWVLWERNHNVLSSIDLFAGNVELIDEKSYTLPFEDLPERQYRHMTLKTENLGNIEAFISAPKTIPKGGLPVVMIMGGLEVNAETFKLIHEPGENIYVIYKYPYAPEYWKEGSPMIEIPIIRKLILNVPSQVLALHQWVSKQPWSQKERVTFTGFSFGAMFLPAIYHLAQSRHIVLNPGVIAFAGADISDLLYTNMHKVNSPWRTIGAWLGETVIYSIDPLHHLPYMNNEFLLINGTQDHQISTYSWKILHQLVAQPKTVVILDVGHMHPRKTQLTRKLVNISRQWLMIRGLVNK